jgi:GT2 family glycosyltransferase
MSDLPSVCFIVLNWNQFEMTSDCLESLQKQDYSNFGIVVVENGSSNESASLLRCRFPWVTVLELSENIGYSSGNNVGIKHALEHDFEYIFLLNNDTEVDPSMLSELISVIESEPTIGITGPTMFYEDPPMMIWGSKNFIDWSNGRAKRRQIGEMVEYDYLQDSNPVEVDYIDSCAILIKRDVFDDIGLLDERYFINFEDVDINVRARSTGYKIIYVPYAFMWHKVSSSMGIGSPATTYYMARNELLFFKTHSPGILRFLAPLRIILRYIRTIGAWTIKSQYKNPLYRRKRAAYIYAIRDFLSGRFGRMGLDVEKVCYG